LVGRFPESRYVPCRECGASIARGETSAHVCDQERWLDYQLFERREEVERLTEEVAAYLDSPDGRFERWCAERERRRSE
jgi:hypothetical protein